MQSSNRERPPLELAYIGDAVFELYAREYVLKNFSLTVDELNKRTRGLVSARAQAKMYNKLAEYLTDDEKEILRRGRNANPHTPKSATVSEYRRATAFEALFGFLYLNGQTERIEELFALVVQNN